MSGSRFSERHGYAPAAVEIRVRHDAPNELRGVLVQLAKEAGLEPKPLRDLVCGILRKRADPNNWSEYPNIHDEVVRLIDDCEWPLVYDIIEGIYRALLRPAYSSYSSDGPAAHAERFASEVNQYFVQTGIGWQLVDGRIEVRGTETFEHVVHQARSHLKQSNRSTAATELHEAITDLSRRPKPDVTGAIQHAMSSLECVARDVSGDPQATLGALIKRSPNLFPKPLDMAVDKLWGYASEYARHVREGRPPDFSEAQLVVGIAASLCTYLASSQERSG